MQTRVDYRLFDHGSIVMLLPVADEVTKWLEENIAGEPQWFGGQLAVEPRYLLALVEGLSEAGFQRGV